jgi:hypothetical protein
MPKTDKNAAWEHVHSKADYDETYRLAVPGGWLYRNVLTPTTESLPVAVTMVFVPRSA